MARRPVANLMDKLALETEVHELVDVLLEDVEIYPKIRIWKMNRECSSGSCYPGLQEMRLRLGTEEFSRRHVTIHETAHLFRSGHGMDFYKKEYELGRKVNVGVVELMYGEAWYHMESVEQAIQEGYWEAAEELKRELSGLNQYKVWQVCDRKLVPYKEKGWTLE